jgi:tetratricopeptide (TPR) repeat protein
MTKAIVKAQESQELLENGQFDQSFKMAEQSRTIAEEVTNASQRSGIQERFARIQRSLSEAEKAGATYFQVTEVKRLLKEAESVKATARTRTYEDIIEELNRIESEFEIVLASTDDQVLGIVAKSREKLDMLEKETDADKIAAESLVYARQALNYTEIDFSDCNYAAAYKNLKAGLDEIEDIEIALAEQSYQIELTTLFRDLSDALTDFDAVISIGPDVLKRMSVGVEGRGQSLAIANSLPPTAFKQKLDDIYLHVLAIEPPPSRASLHKRAVAAIKEARMAGAEFQKFLIFDELDRRSIYKTVDQAYKHLETMNRHRAGVQERLLNTGANLDVVPARRARGNGIVVQTSSGLQL